MGNLTSGWLNDCTTGTCPGGVGAFYVANANQVSAISVNATGAATGITMTSTASVFYKLECRDNSAVFTSNTKVDVLTKAKSIEQKLTGVFECRSQALRNLLSDMADQRCGLVLVHVENTGTHWIWGDILVGGKRRTGILTTQDGSSGTVFTDPNQESIEITCQTTSKEKTLINGSAVMLTLT